MCDFTKVIPVEITQQVLKLLSAKELQRFQSVCLNWRELGNEDSLWTKFCLTQGWTMDASDKKLLLEKPFSAKRSNISGNSPLFPLEELDFTTTRLSPICRWKLLFLKRRHLNKNWSKGRYTVAPRLNGHTDKVTALDCLDWCLVSGSDDKILRVWDLRICECVKQIKGHSDTIAAVKILTDGQVVTGCGDSIIRVINTTSGKVIFTLTGHSGSVDHLCVVNSLVVSSGTDRTIRVWSLKLKELVYILRSHTDEIECMSSNGNFILTGSWDRTLVLWDLNTGQAVHTLVGHNEVVNACQFDYDKVVSGSADGDVRIWNCHTGHCVHLLQGHTEEVYCVAYYDEVIASGSADSTIILWSFEGVRLHTLKEHMGVVRCLHINRDRLVSGGDQMMVVVWDYKTGNKLTVLHRHPTKLHLMWVGDTKLITASPEKIGTITALFFW